MKTILLILIGVSSLMASNFTRNVGGVVTDSRTNLEWQDDSSDNSNSLKQAKWQNAIDYCENLNLDGKSDWRLPNLNELTSLVDDRRTSPAIDTIFQNTNPDFYWSYWSSTTSPDDKNDAWIVDFMYGRQDGNNKDDSNPVRCVREGQ